MTSSANNTISEGLAARQERRIKEIMHEDKCTFAGAYNKVIEQDHAIARNDRMAQALFEVDAPDHLEWADVGLDKRERYLCLADTAIHKATTLGLSS